MPFLVIAALRLAWTFLMAWLLMLVLPLAGRAVGLDLDPTFWQTFAFYVVCQVLFTASDLKIDIKK